MKTLNKLLGFSVESAQSAPLLASHRTRGVLLAVACLAVASGPGWGEL